MLESNGRRLNELLVYFPKMLAVETESWGVLIAAWMSKDPPRFIPIRGISDNADKWKGDKWQKFSALCAYERIMWFKSVC